MQKKCKIGCDESTVCEFCEAWRSVSTISHVRNGRYDHNNEQEVWMWLKRNHGPSPPPSVYMRRLTKTNWQPKIGADELCTMIKKANLPPLSWPTLIKKQVSMLPPNILECMLIIYNFIFVTEYSLSFLCQLNWLNQFQTLINAFNSLWNTYHILAHVPQRKNNLNHPHKSPISIIREKN